MNEVKNIEEYLSALPKGLRIILENANGIALNANDFFNYAYSDELVIDICDLVWMSRIAEKYGNDGVNAIMAYIGKEMPLSEYQTKDFKLAYEELVTLNPKVWSE